MISFTNKIITTENQIITTTITTPISKRISPDLWSSFSNLNFSGVFRIGSPTIKNLCYIASGYNITTKVTHHLNLLYRGVHHSEGLQKWVNENGLDNIDVSVLTRTKANPDEFEIKEQYFLNLIKPKFNSVLHKRNINVERKEVKRLTHRNHKHLNEFNQPIYSKYNLNYNHTILRIINNSEAEDERKFWKPTIIINVGNETSIVRGDITNINPVKAKPKAKSTETFVRRKGIF